MYQKLLRFVIRLLSQKYILVNLVCVCVLFGCFEIEFYSVIQISLEFTL